MNSFKDLAYTILKESGKPLHSKEITKRALKIGLITEGKTPEATMNAQLVVDINIKKEKSRFIKTDPSTFSINPEFEETKQKIEKEKKAEKIYKISKKEGGLGEGIFARLLTAPKARLGWERFRNSAIAEYQNRKIFFSLIERNFGGARLKKCRENFSVLLAEAKRRRVETHLILVRDFL